MFKDIDKLIRSKKSTIIESVNGQPVEEDSCVVFFVVKPGTKEAVVEDRIKLFQHANNDVFEGGRYYHLGSRSNGRVLVNALEKAMGLQGGFNLSSSNPSKLLEDANNGN